MSSGRSSPLRPLPILGSLDVAFSDYGVSVPSAPIVVSADDEGVIELQLYFSEG